MKRVVLSILAVLYLSASTGTTVDMHYCMGKLVDWTLAHEDSSSCGNCGMEKKGTDNGCCKDEQKFFKNTDDQKTASQQVQVPVLQISDLPEQRQELPDPAFAVFTVELPKANAPPDKGDAPIFLRNRVILI